MFGFKKTVQIITLTAEDGRVLISCPVGEYTLPEEAQIKLSIAYYSDPEPCEIHRGAVTKRAMLEILQLCPAGKSVAIASLGEDKQGWFPAEAAFVTVTEEKK